MDALRKANLRRGAAGVAALGLLGMGTAACGSSRNASASQGNAGGASSGGTITIGVLAPFTGPNAQAASDLMKGIDLAVKEVNAAGGADGKQLKVVTGDTVSDPTDAVSAASKLINADSAQIVIGPRTVTGPAILPVTQRSKVPEFIVGGSTVLDKNTDPYFFRTTPSDSQQGVAMAAYAIQKGWKRAALAFELQPAAQTLKAPITDAYTRHGGKIVTTVDISPGQSSYRSEIQKLYSQHPDVIFTQVSAQTASVFFPEVKQLEGLNTPFIGTNVFDSTNFFQAVGPEIATSPIYATQSSSSAGAGSAHYLQEYQQAYGTNQAANLSPDIYDAVILAALAIDESGATTGKAVADAVTKVSNPPGVSVSTYAQGLAAIKNHQKINYDGAAGNQDMNQYHNVFGPFQVLQFTKTGSTQTVATLPTSLLSSF